jgi:hypothetical protein
MEDRGMTPLAKAIAEAAVSNPKWWRESGNEKLLAPFPRDVKCFEVTAVVELAHELAQQAYARGDVAESLAFLPAPVTWLEQRYTREDGKPALQAYLLVDQGNNIATVTSTIGVEINRRTVFIPVSYGNLRLLDEADPDGLAIDSIIVNQGVDPESYGKSLVRGLVPLRPGAKAPRPHERNLDDQLDDAQERSWRLYATLSLINSPRIVRRSDHKASSGLQKFLNRKGDGQYNLLPWHEVFLDITPPPEAVEVSDGVSRLTGPRALHFCRQHIRIKRGKLEMVRAHYRGSADVGIAQTQYRVGTA